MTIPKNAGLSHLADVADESIGVYSYPIKKKGQPRRLDPNWGGINWLEDQSETDAEISEEYDAGEPVFNDDAVYLGTEFKVQRALGWHGARRKSMYPWPMFQVFPAVSFKIRMVPYSPCPDCDDWSRTSKCAEHYDDGAEGLKKGHERRQAREQARRVVDFRVDNSEARYTPNDGRRYYTHIEQMDERNRQMREQARLYTQTPCTCSMCTGRTQDPNEGRPGYHYNLANDRWERDTDDALGDFRAGGFQMPDELLQFSAVPDELRPTCSAARMLCATSLTGPSRSTTPPSR